MCVLCAVRPVRVLHPLKMSKCPTATRERAYSRLGACGTLWLKWADERGRFAMGRCSVRFGSQAEERRSKVTVTGGVLVEVVLVVLLSAVEVLQRE